jgi:hypothetical protein
VTTDQITEPTLKLCLNTISMRRLAEVARAAGLHAIAQEIEGQIPSPLEALVQDFAGQDLLWSVHADRLVVLRHFAACVRGLETETASDREGAEA